MHCKLKLTLVPEDASVLYPLLKIDEMFAKLHGPKIFTMLNLHSGYYHISLSKAAKPKTAFITPHGKWLFNMVPFGLAQAPIIFSSTHESSSSRSGLCNSIFG